MDSINRPGTCSQDGEWCVKKVTLCNIAISIKETRWLSYFIFLEMVVNVSLVFIRNMQRQLEAEQQRARLQQQQQRLSQQQLGQQQLGQQQLGQQQLGQQTLSSQQLGQQSAASSVSMAQRVMNTPPRAMPTNIWSPNQPLPPRLVTNK